MPLVGKRPRLQSWFKLQEQAPTEAQVREWWGLWPNANIGLVCGKTAGIAVVDLDGDLELALEYFLNNGIHFEDCPRVTTGKGHHLYYRHPGGSVPNGVKVYARETLAAKIAIDIRGDGGYVVAPPSFHENGNVYGWDNPETIDGELPLLPARFTKAEPIERPAPQAAGDPGTSEIERMMRGVSSGGRNDAAAKLAGFWMRVTREDIASSWQALRLWNLQNQPPLNHSELTRTFDSIVALRKRNPDTRRQAEPVEAKSIDALDGKSWAERVRDSPPRAGVQTWALPAIDRMGGLVPRDLVILAGRPGMGKSTCAWNIVAECCVAPHGPRVPTVVFSTEMTADDVARWMASKLFETAVPHLEDHQWHRTLELLAAAPVTMVDQGSLTIENVEEVVRSRPETRIVIIDHVQRMRTTGRENRNLELGHIAQRLKTLAKDTPCAVLLLSQMNRASDLDGRPRLAALRDSGELEQEADGVIFLWSQADDPTANPLRVEFYLAKNRHGALVSVEYSFVKDLKRFDPISGEEICARMDHVRREQEHLLYLTRGSKA